MDRQVGACCPVGKVKDLGLWPLQGSWSRFGSFASFPVPFAAGFHRNKPRRYQRSLSTVVSSGARGLIHPRDWSLEEQARLLPLLTPASSTRSPQGLSDWIVNSCFIECNLWEPPGPALEIILLEGISLALAWCQGFCSSEILVYSGVCGSVLSFGWRPNRVSCCLGGLSLLVSVASSLSLLSLGVQEPTGACHCAWRL